MWALLVPIIVALVGTGGIVSFFLWRSTARKLNAEADKTTVDADVSALAAAQGAYKDLYDEMRTRDAEVRRDLAQATGEISGLRDRVGLAEQRQIHAEQRMTNAEDRERACLVELAALKEAKVSHADLEALVNERVRTAVDRQVGSALDAFEVKK